ncbi:MAG: acetylxylan esterase [Spirochaetes bacterium]|nr:acetylxylan esterase [Spirochaetota bacterium]
MATLLQFDKYINYFPPLTKEPDFDHFWSIMTNEVKKVSMQGEYVLNKKRSNSRFNIYDVTFRSYMKTIIHADLYIPVNAKNKIKPKPVIICHDYNSINQYKGYGVLENYAYLYIKMRGHHSIIEPLPNTPEAKEKTTPGFMTEQIYEPKNYYLTGVFLDLYRSIDFLRLVKEIDCSEIAIIAKGISASAALFTQCYNKRVTKLVLDSPLFVDLETSQNLSKSDSSSEINSFISTLKRDKIKIKKNLSYFDGLNFTQKVDSDILMSIGLRDDISPAKCALSLFHYLNCDKTVEVYPEDNNECGGMEQFQKSLKWIKSRMS